MQLRTMLQDLLLNFFSEAVGILVTVFIIDRLLKWREEKRWLPLKHFVYAKLLEIAGKLLYGILPPKYRKMTNVVYEYGLVSSSPQVEITPSLDEVTMTELLAEIDRDMQSRNRFEIELLAKSKQQIDDILIKSAFLLEPEFLALLLELDRALTSSLRFEANWEDESTRWNFVLCLTQIALTAIDLREWLDRQVSRSIATESTTEEMLRKTNKLYSKLQRNVFNHRKIRI